MVMSDLSLSENRRTPSSLQCVAQASLSGENKAIQLPALSSTGLLTRRGRHCTKPELRSCVKVEVAILGSLSLIVHTVSVDEKQHLKKKNYTNRVGRQGGHGWIGVAWKQESAVSNLQLTIRFSLL